MRAEERLAFVISQAAVLMATVAGMQAENQYRLARGETIAYAEQAFVDAIAQSGCGHHAVIALFNGDS